MKNFKKWLNECNEEGCSNGDAITMVISTCIAFTLLIVLCKICG